MLPQADNTLLRTDEWRKDLGRRLCGTAVSNLSKTSGIRIKLCINIYYLQINCVCVLRVPKILVASVDLVL
jgi:hypothetical protein